MQTTRRTFLAQSLGTAAALTVAPSTSLGAEAAGAIPIVDTHQHLWDLSVVHPPWLKPGGELTRNFVTQDYLEATAGLNVTTAVYMEVAVADDQLVAEAEHVIGLCADENHPTCAAVIGGRPASDGFRAYLNRFRDNPCVKGVRHIMGQPEMLEAAGLTAGLQLLGERGLCFDLCVPPRLLEAAAKLVDACPETRIVVDHCGNADPVAFMAEADHPRAPQHDADAWRRDMQALAKRKNTICKISGIVARMEKERWKPEDLAAPISHCLDVFGPDRVIFASDWPVCTRGASLRQWVEALQQVVRDRPASEQHKLFSANALAFYGLT